METSVESEFEGAVNVAKKGKNSEDSSAPKDEAKEGQSLGAEGDESECCSAESCAGSHEDGGSKETKSAEAVVDFEKVALQSRVKNLESKVAEYEAKFADAREYIKKMESEIDQIRIRFERDRQKTLDLKIGEFFLGILPVLDNLDLSLKAAEKESGSFVEGVRLIHKQFAESLKRQGLERLEVKNLPFDPHLHEALTSIPVQDESKDGMVLDEVKAGYRFKDQVIRPAQVVVGKRPE